MLSVLFGLVCSFSFQFYHDVCAWLGVRDVPARLHQLLHISSTYFYQTLIPTEQTLIMPPLQMEMRTGAGARSSGASSSSSAPGPAQIDRTPKRLHTWSSEEWRTFGINLCAYIQDQIEDFQPAFMHNKTLAGVLGQKAAEEDGDSAADACPPNAAEVCIMQVLRCFAQGPCN